LYQLSSPIGRGAGGEGEWQTFSPPDGFERNQMFLDEMRHFLAVVRGETEPTCTLEDGRQALQLALAVLESDRTGQKVILEEGIS